MRIIALVFGMWMLGTTTGAAFPCANVKLPWDIVVCADIELQTLADQRLEAFEQAKARLSPQQIEKLRKQQAAWVHSYSASCGIRADRVPPSPVLADTIECFRRAGQARLAYLRAYQNEQSGPGDDIPSRSLGPATAGNLSDVVDAIEADGRGDYATEFKLLRPLAEQGNVGAQDRLGSLYANGLGAPQNDAEAVLWFGKAAEQGFAHAQGSLGDIYYNGRGVPRDYTEAARWYRKAADQGDANAQAHLGGMYFNGQGLPKDLAEAILWFDKAAEQGDPRAESVLGAMYDDGGVLPKDYAKAVRWYRKAAEQGIPQAQYNLAVMYANGRGVPQEEAEANRWFREAAERGSPSAQSLLGGMYFLGRGVPKDYVQAYMWLNLAAGGGNNDAVKARELVEQLMTAAQIAEAQKLTREWKPK